MAGTLIKWRRNYPIPMKENVSTDKLSYLLKQLTEQPLGTDLSDMALSSLARSYIAIHNMVVVLDQEKEYGSREFYRQRIDELYAICDDRLNEPGFDLECRVPLIYMLYQLLLNPTLCAVDSEKQQRCDTLAYEAVRNYLQELSVGRLNEKPKMEFEICRLIVELCCDLDEAEREEEEMMLHFWGKLATWTDALVNGDHWIGISDCEALQRLLLLCRNSDMLLDTTYDYQLRCLWEYYSKRVLFLDKKSIVSYQVLALFYEITSSISLASLAPRLKQQIMELMFHGSETFPKNSEEQIFCLAWALKGICRQCLQETFV